MKQLSFSQDFDCPLEFLLELRQERYKNPERYPELKDIQIISEKQEGAKIYQEKHISLSAKLPEGIAAFWPSSLEKLSEKSTFDTEQQIHEFEVFPEGQGDSPFFHMKGKSEYKTLGPTRCQRKYEIEVESKAFLIGGLVENLIADIYVKNLEKDRQITLKTIASHALDTENKEVNHSEEISKEEEKNKS